MARHGKYSIGSSYWKKTEHRSGWRLEKVSKGFCSKMTHDIKDEEMGARRYGKMYRLGKKEGMATADYRQFWHMKKDEEKHKRFLVKFKKKYCGR